MKKNVRIFWVVDNQILGKGFESLLHSELDDSIKNQSLSKQNVLDYHFKEEENTQSVLILQLHLSQSDSNLKMYKFLRNKPWMKVVILMNQFDFRKTQFLFNLGVSGVIFEDIDAVDFISVMKNVLEGKKGISSGMRDRIIEEYCSKKEAMLINESNPHHAEEAYERSTFSENLYSLTKREKEILKLICDGKLTREIADQLFISLHTIETHRRNILSKMEVKNTAHMVKVAISEGLV